MKNYIKQNSGRFILGGLAVIALVAGSIAKIISSSYAIDGGITNLSIVDDTNAEVKENANISIDKTNHTAKIYNVKIQAFFPQEVEGDEYIDVTLKNGLEWNDWEGKSSLPDKLLSVTGEDKLQTEEYKKTLEIYKTYKDASNYTTKFGTKRFEINKEKVGINNEVTITVKIAADRTLNYSEIKDAITAQAKIKIGDSIEDFGLAKTLSVNVTYPDDYITINGQDKDYKIIYGSKKDANSNYIMDDRLVGLYDKNYVSLYMDYVKVVITTPANTRFEEFKSGGAEQKTSARTDWTYDESSSNISAGKHVFIIKKVNLKLGHLGINPVWNFSNINVEENQQFQIKVDSVTYKTFGGKEVTKTTNYKEIFKILDTEKVEARRYTGVSGFDINNKNEIIKLGGFLLSNDSPIDSEEKYVEITAPDNLCISGIRLPAVLKQDITDLEYKINDNQVTKATKSLYEKLGSPVNTGIDKNSPLGYVQFTRGMVTEDNNNNCITYVKYKIGTIVGKASNIDYQNAFIYFGTFKDSLVESVKAKLEDDTLPNVTYKVNIKIYGDKFTTNGFSYVTVYPYTLTIYPKNTMNSNIYYPGETMNFKYNLEPISGSREGGIFAFYNPIIYIKLPKGLSIKEKDLTIKNNDKEECTKYKIENYDITRNNKTYTIYKITWPKNDPEAKTGYFGNNLYDKKYVSKTIEFSVDIPEFYRDSEENYLYSDTVYVTDKYIKRVFPDYESPYANYGDPYDVNNDGETSDVMSYQKPGNNYQIKTQVDINATVKVKDDDYKYLDNNESIKIENDKAQIKVISRNDSNVTARKEEIYVPIPKKNENWGTDFMYKLEENYKQFEFNMYVEKIQNPDSNKYKIFYAQDVTPTGKISDLQKIKWYSESDVSSWSESDFEKVNIVKITSENIQADDLLEVDINMYTKNEGLRRTSYNNYRILYYRDLTIEGNVLSGWKRTNYVSFNKEKNGEEIVVPITSSARNIILVTTGILISGIGIYMIARKKNKIKNSVQ